MTRKILALALLASTAFAMIAALGCTEKVHPPTSPGPGPGPTGPPLTPDSVQTVFNGYCNANCHNNGTSSQAQLDLTPDSSYAFLVNVVSFRSDPLLRVKPSVPDSSALVLRVEGTSLGARMPFLSAELPAAEKAILRNWVAQGAGAVYAEPTLQTLASHR
jgi:hypothetical protein